MIVYLGLGANLGNREETINKALKLLSEQVGPLVKRSSFFYSKPMDFDSPNDFCNICASFDTQLAPLDLLHTTQAIERTLGRTRKSRNGIHYDREIDIDILLYEGVQMATPELTLPHPEIKKRDFVTSPLNEIL